MDVVTYVLSRKYTDKSIKGISGTLVGKNCTIASIEQVEGGNLVTFEWYSDEGDTQTSTMFVQDGVLGENAIAPTYDPTQTYNKNDLVVYENELYKLGVSTTTGEFNPNVWDLTNIDELLATKANSVDLATVATSGSASDVSFDNSETELDSTNVQDAIVEVLEEAGKIADVQTYGNTLVTNKIADLSALTIKKSIANTPTDIASFDDGTANPMPSLEISIEPVQSGSGDPSPSNVRPISGWSGANVTRTGKNILGINEVYDNKTGITINDNAATGNNVSFSQVFFNIPKNLIGKQLTLSTKIAVPNNVTRMYSQAIVNNVQINGNDILSNTTGVTSVTFTPESTEDSFRITYGSGNGAITVSDFQVEISATPTAYTPYQGSTLSIPFHDSSDNPITVYGGQLNVTTGELTVTHKSQIVNENTSVARNDDFDDFIRWTVSASDAAVVTNQDVRKRVIANNLRSTAGVNATINAISLISNRRIAMNISTDIATDPTTLKNWLSNNNIHFVYELDTPITYQLTPTQVTTLLEQNNISADCGQILSGEYFADASTVIAGLDARITALENA